MTLRCSTHKPWQPAELPDLPGTPAADQGSTRNKIKTAYEAACLVYEESMNLKGMMQPFLDSSSPKIRTQIQRYYDHCVERKECIDTMLATAEEYVFRAKMLPASSPHLNIYENELTSLVEALDELENLDKTKALA